MSTIPRVIIADDEPEFRSMTAAVLGAQNYEFVMANDGAEALAAAREQSPDLMLLDVNMPGMDGVEACEELRADPQLAEVPVVLFTGLSDREARLRGFEAGADDFLGKPYDPDELRLRVRGITRLNRFRHIHDQRRRTERVIAIARDGYVLVGKDGVLLQANPAAWRLLGGIPEQGGCELNFMDLVRKSYRCEPAEAWAGDIWTPATKPRLLVGKDRVSSQARWLQLDVLDPYSSEERWFRLLDVSHEHALQCDLWVFHAAVSHKLRTPLNGLLGSLDLLMMDLEPQGEDMLELVGMAKDSAVRLEESITGILSYLGAGRRGGEQSQEAWSVSNLPGMIKEVADRVGIGSVTTNLIETAGQGALTLRPDALSLCLEAVLDNARKFHPQKTPVLNVTVISQSGQLCIAIQDDGIHLPSTALSDVWEPYFQQESRSTGEVSGMGLGLAMVSAIVLEAGGERCLRNRADCPGVEVEIRLPITPAAESEPITHSECILQN